mmetsp:Transcript_105900/g.299356  ORF Transcript_105900/g.299356 Transcript_105900/m.299356 type:complete len:228 (+) Transcript_105900:199-882(+)
MNRTRTRMVTRSVALGFLVGDRGRWTNRSPAGFLAGAPSVQRVLRSLSQHASQLVAARARAFQLASARQVPVSDPEAAAGCAGGVQSLPGMVRTWARLACGVSRPSVGAASPTRRGRGERVARSLAESTNRLIGAWARDELSVAVDQLPSTSSKNPTAVLTCIRSITAAVGSWPWGGSAVLSACGRPAHGILRALLHHAGNIVASRAWAGWQRASGKMAVWRWKKCP